MTGGRGLLSTLRPLVFVLLSRNQAGLHHPLRQRTPQREPVSGLRENDSYSFETGRGGQKFLFQSRPDLLQLGSDCLEVHMEGTDHQLSGDN